MEIAERKKALSSEQREEQLRALKNRFEQNMNRHKYLGWTSVQARLEANPERLRSLHAMGKLAVSRTLLVLINGRANTSFLIARRKALPAAEAFVTIVKDGRRGRMLNQKIARWIWRLPWALSY